VTVQNRIFFTYLYICFMYLLTLAVSTMYCDPVRRRHFWGVASQVQLVVYAIFILCCVVLSSVILYDTVVGIGQGLVNKPNSNCLLLKGKAQGGAKIPSLLRWASGRLASVLGRCGMLALLRC